MEGVRVSLPYGFAVRLSQAEFIAVVDLRSLHRTLPHAVCALHGHRLPAGKIPGQAHIPGMGRPQAEAVPLLRRMCAEPARRCSPCAAEKCLSVQHRRPSYPMDHITPAASLLPKFVRNSVPKYFIPFPPPRQETHSSGHCPLRGRRRCMIHSVCSWAAAAPMPKSSAMLAPSRRSICSMTRMSLSTSMASD